MSVSNGFSYKPKKPVLMLPKVIEVNKYNYKIKLKQIILKLQNMVKKIEIENQFKDPNND
jgi:hypothetical protein